MPMIVPIAGRIELLDKQLRDALSVDETYKVRLYTAVAPALGAATVTANFTEATFTGYTEKTLNRSDWGAAADVGGGVVRSVVAQQQWLPTSARTVVGYYVVATTSGVTLFAEAFAAPRALQNGDTLNLTPRFEKASQA